MTQNIKVKVEEHIIELSNLDKILFPQSKITKGDLISYYSKIANHMVYFMTNHPVTMRRFPDGIDKTGFYQKDASDYFPKWIKTIPIKRKSLEEKTVNYVICNNKATLVYLANQACITPHIWLSEYSKPTYPDRMIFDLDPSIEDFDLVKTTALHLKEILENKGLNPFAMTTGSRGIHVTIPLDKKVDFDTVKDFATKCAQELVSEYPSKLTTELRKDKRDDKLFIDTLRNRYSATGVAPYAVRAKEKAPVATPLFWQELKDPKLKAQSFNINNIFNKISSDGNPWENFYKFAKTLPKY